MNDSSTGSERVTKTLDGTLIAFALVNQVVSNDLLRSRLNVLSVADDAEAALIREWLDHGFGARELVLLTDILLYKYVVSSPCEAWPTLLDNCLSNRSLCKSLGVTLGPSLERDLVFGTALAALRTSPFSFVDSYSEVLDLELSDPELEIFRQHFLSVSKAHLSAHRMRDAKANLHQSCIEKFGRSHQYGAI